MARNSSDERNSHPLDVALGVRVRLRRKELGLSQSDLANATGITFQQVQKYEKGTNRISFSRLVEIAQALGCNVRDLIGDLESNKAARAQSKNTSGLRLTGAADLLEAYNHIRSAESRRALLKLARQLAGDE